MSLITSQIANMRKQTGFTLIEILVTVLVLAIGLLGLAGLQATTLRFNSSAYLRSQATNLAYDIADRMRANVIAARNGNYDVNFGFAAPAGTTLAATDLREWRQALINTLPAGTGQITRNPVAGTLFTITIQWDDSRGQAAPQTFQTMTDL